MHSRWRSELLAGLVLLQWGRGAPTTAGESPALRLWALRSSALRYGSSPVLATLRVAPAPSPAVSRAPCPRTQSHFQSFRPALVGFSTTYFTALSNSASSRKRRSYYSLCQKVPCAR